MKVDYMIKVLQWKRVQIKDRTHYTLSNGKKIPTFLNMERQLIKGK